MILSNYFQEKIFIKVHVFFLIAILAYFPIIAVNQDRNRLFSWKMFSMNTSSESYKLTYKTYDQFLSRSSIVSKYKNTEFFPPYGLDPLQNLCHLDDALKRIERTGRFSTVHECQQSRIGKK